MTLLLSMTTPTSIIIGADGKSINKSNKKTLKTNVQKIFPLPNRPIAIAHHGQNVISGRDVEQIITSFATTIPAAFTISDLAQQLATQLDQDVRTTQDSLAKQGVQDGVGFWVAGFAPDDTSPQLVEVFWPPPNQVQPGQKIPSMEMRTGLIEGGDCKQYSQESRKMSARFDFTTEDLGRKSQDWWSKYIGDLYRLAKALQKVPKSFGGKYHELWIEKSECHWKYSP